MMKNKDGTLGRPGYVWRKGQERRLNLIRKYVSLENKKILDVGCGEGLYLRRFKDFSDLIYGVDIDKEKIEKIRTSSLRSENLVSSLRSEIKNEFPNVYPVRDYNSKERAQREHISNRVKVAPAENLPFLESFFDIILFNEVLEHLKDDRKAIKEAFRCLKKGGKIIIFAPNRLYLFETHGIYLKGVYHFGNFPFVNYLPNSLRKKICPHVRAYTKRDILKLFSNFNYKILVFTQIYPGFDKIALRCRTLSSILRRIFYFLEKTPLRVFGLSHFIIIEKI